MYVSDFEITPSTESYFLRDPVEVVFTAIKPSTIYSFRFIRHDPPAKPIVSN
jgi:hypothetical protein